MIGAEKINSRSVITRQGTAKAVGYPNARQTYVPLPTQQKGQAATLGASVPVVLAGNARQTHPYNG
jgi:hypothetical protein